MYQDCTDCWQDLVRGWLQDPIATTVSKSEITVGTSLVSLLVGVFGALSEQILTLSH